MRFTISYLMDISNFNKNIFYGYEKANDVNLSIKKSYFVAICNGKVIQTCWEIAHEFVDYFWLFFMGNLSNQMTWIKSWSSRGHCWVLLTHDSRISDFYRFLKYWYKNPKLCYHDVITEQSPPNQNTKFH